MEIQIGEWNINLDSTKIERMIWYVINYDTFNQSQSSTFNYFSNDNKSLRKMQLMWYMDNKLKKKNIMFTENRWISSNNIALVAILKCISSHIFNKLCRQIISKAEEICFSVHHLFNIIYKLLSEDLIDIWLFVQ